MSNSDISPPPRGHPSVGSRSPRQTPASSPRQPLARRQPPGSLEPEDDLGFLAPAAIVTLAISRVLTATVTLGRESGL